MQRYEPAGRAGASASSNLTRSREHSLACRRDRRAVPARARPSPGHGRLSNSPQGSRPLPERARRRPHDRAVSALPRWRGGGGDVDCGFM